MARKLSAEEITEKMMELAEQLAETATADTRRDVADALTEQFIDRSKSCITFTDTPADSIIATLRVSKKTTGTRFVALADRFDREGVSADFQLGIQFAIAMIRDADFEL